jgi:hypothetical protein
MTASGNMLAPLLMASLLAGPAFAQDAPDYRDDRSTPEAVVESLYNAVSRKEFLRAYSYFHAGAEVPPLEEFAKGYAETARARVRTGKATSDGAAGSIFFSLPVVVESVSTSGKSTVYAGCYELRLVQPAVQAMPPFQPLGIVKGRLAESSASFAEAKGKCAADGLE